MAKREWVRLSHPKIKAKATVAKSAVPQMQEQGWHLDKPEANDKSTAPASAGGQTDKKEK